MGALLVVVVVAFVLGFAGSMPVAGPIAVMVVTRGAEGRFRDALRLAFGASAAEAIWAFLAFWGFATFATKYPVVLPISRGITALVLLVVGASFLRWKPKAKGDLPARAHREGSPLVLGFGMAVLNPTLVVTWSAVTTALYSLEVVELNGWLALPFGIAAGSGVITWFVVLVGLMRRYGKRFPAKAMMWTVRGMGLLLVLVAVWAGVGLVRKLTSGGA